MFNNLKDFVTAVQEGITSNNNLRHTLQEVQKVKYIFKEKSRPSNETKVNYYAGSAILDKYQKDWSEMHQNSEKNAILAERVDRVIIDVHEAAKLRLIHANDLGQTLASLPKLTLAVEECIESLKEVQSAISIVEEQLTDLEDLVERSNMAKWKMDHYYQFNLYKEKKLASLEDVRGQLAKENTTRNIERGQKELAEMQQRQSISATAFKNDISQFKSAGILPNIKSSSITQQLSLEQINLEEDNDDLDKFLNS